MIGPIRVLHVVEPRAGEEHLLACKMSLRVAEAEHEVLVLGSERDAVRAETLGVAARDHIAAPLGMAELAGRRYARLFWERYWGPMATRQTPHVQMLWSMGAMRMVWAGLGRSGPAKVGMLGRACLNYRSGGWEYRRDARGLKGVTAFCFNRHVRTTYAFQASEIRGGRYLEQNIRLLPTPIGEDSELVKLAAQRAEEKARLRQELGIPEHHVSVALLADPPEAGDAYRFAFLLGLMFVAQIRVSGIVPTGVGMLTRAAKLLRDHDHRWGMAIADWPLEKRLAAADVAVVLTPEPRTPRVYAGNESCGSTSVAMALGMGVPVFGQDQLWLRELLGMCAEDGLAKAAWHQPVLNAIAGKMIRSLTDARQVEALSRRAMGQGKDLASGERFERTLTDLWREVIGYPIAQEGLPTPPMLVSRENRPVSVDG